ncbi:hypothetical protein [Zavarzinella formosa]|uniref:hypothetical protein n=1 Tax=Zavarzinella formosa TaxID=360055 RepID=UPI00030AD790|nr:hypothetical protein [Zavarzinella formosa]
MPSEKRPSAAPTATTDRATKVIVTRHGIHTVVNPFIRDLWKDLHTFSPEADGTIVSYPLLRVIRPGEPAGLFGHAGLEGVIVDWLQKHGHHIVLEGTRPAVLPAPSLGWLCRQPWPTDRAMLDFVRRRERGLIRCDASRVDPARLAGQAARAWPKTMLVMTMASPAGAWTLGGRLRAYEDKLRILDDNHPRNETARVMVADHARLGEEALVLDRRDFWFALRPEELFASPGPTIQQGFPQAGTCRLFGLLPLDFSPSPFQKCLLASVCGRDEIIVRQHGHDPRPADVVFLPTSAGPLPGKNIPDENLKRQGLWDHPVRNQLICRLADLFQTGDIKAIRREFPMMAAMTAARLTGRVAIRVGCLDHAQAILALRPELSLIGDRSSGGQAAHHPRVSTALKREVSGSRLHLAVGVSKFAGPPSSVLINASLAAPPESPETESGFGCPEGRLLVIDFQDEHHPRLREWSKGRMHACDDAGWKVAGGAVPSPWERFQADRLLADPESLTRLT